MRTKLDGTLSLFVLSYTLLPCNPSYVIVHRMPPPCCPSSLVTHGAYKPHRSDCYRSLHRFFLFSFMGPLAGVMVSDYYLVRKAKLNVGELYNPNGLYRYDHGWNWRAFVSFL
jgi:Permease for cytosine/purines, uracil, thiamine, allantoin